MPSITRFVPLSVPVRVVRSYSLAASIFILVPLPLIIFFSLLSTMFSLPDNNVTLFLPSMEMVSACKPIDFSSIMMTDSSSLVMVTLFFAMTVMASVPSSRISCFPVRSVMTILPVSSSKTMALPLRVMMLLVLLFSSPPFPEAEWNMAPVT